jgi:hypothetical protein
MVRGMCGFGPGGFVAEQTRWLPVKKGKRVSEMKMISEIKDTVWFLNGIKTRCQTFIYRIFKGHRVLSR